MLPCFHSPLRARRLENIVVQFKLECFFHRHARPDTNACAQLCAHGCSHADHGLCHFGQRLAEIPSPNCHGEKLESGAAGPPPLKSYACFDSTSPAQPLSDTLCQLGASQVQAADPATFEHRVAGVVAFLCPVRLLDARSDGCSVCPACAWHCCAAFFSFACLTVPAAA